MATKTISIDMDAYGRLVQARRSERESFSCVIKRAKWAGSSRTAGNLLEAVFSAPALNEEALNELERGQTLDRPAEDKWTRR